MSETLSLTTELDAVNTMLDVIGEAPVSTINDTGLIDAAMARDLLRKTSREVQAQAWHWNTDRNVELVPTVPLPGNILVPPDALRVDPSDPTISAVQRGTRLWDQTNNTFAWSQSVRVNIVRFLPFSDIPEVARHYIAVRAARMFQDRRIGSESRNGFNERDETRARVAIENENSEAGGASMGSSYAVSRILNPWAPLGGLTSLYR